MKVELESTRFSTYLTLSPQKHYKERLMRENCNQKVIKQALNSEKCKLWFRDEIDFKDSLFWCLPAKQAIDPYKHYIFWSEGKIKWKWKCERTRENCFGVFLLNFIEKKRN